MGRLLITVFRWHIQDAGTWGFIPHASVPELNRKAETQGPFTKSSLMTAALYIYVYRDVVHL